MSLFDRDKSAGRVPVSIVTGFLGSGKTTLLNRLLRDPATGPTAVIVNEFGEVPIDHLLVAPVAGEVAVMANGCVCCTFRGDLADALRGLLAGRDGGTVPHFDRVLVETTGLADPAPIAQMLLNNPLVSHFARLDAIVTTVDVAHAPGQLAAHPQAVKQVALADRLLLTKSDLADPAPVLPRLRALNPAAPLITAPHGAATPEALFGAGPIDPAHKAPEVGRWLHETAYHEHHHEPEGPDAIAACCLRFAEPLDWMAVCVWLDRLRGPELLRVKGVLALDGEDGPVVIHGVQHIFHPPVRLDAWPDDDHQSRVVFIGRGIGRAAVVAAARDSGLPEPV